MRVYIADGKFASLAAPVQTLSHTYRKQVPKTELVRS